MLEYIVVCANKTQDLIDEVNEWIAKGFIPLGGVATTDNDMCQAMIKKEG